MNPEPPPLPWIAEPDIPAGAIGWRMGSGEDAHDAFYRWFSSVSDEEAAAFQKNNPEPQGWGGFYRKIRNHPWI